MKIAVDAMGGDYAPLEIVFGAVRAAKKYDCEIVLVGDEPAIRKVLEHEPEWEKLGISIVHASQVIGMDEHPAAAVRRKRDSSIRVGLELVASGGADAFVSAGNTGAVMATATLVLKRTPGVERPGILTHFPTITGEPAKCSGVSAACATPRMRANSSAAGSPLISRTTRRAGSAEVTTRRSSVGSK